MKLSEEHRRKISQSKLGKPRPESVKLAISRAQKGVPESPEANNKRREWNLTHNWKPPINKGPDCYRWHGGKKKLKGGYIGVYNQAKQTYVPEHRLVMENFLGRKLHPKEVVHHINGNKVDNRVENLKLYSTSGAHIMKNHSHRDKSTGKFIHSCPL